MTVPHSLHAILSAFRAILQSCATANLPHISSDMAACKHLGSVHVASQCLSFKAGRAS